MTTEQHLDAIKSKCRADIMGYVSCDSILSDAQRRALAALRSTLSAIHGLQRFDDAGSVTWLWAQQELARIRAAWPEELLGRESAAK